MMYNRDIPSGGAECTNHPARCSAEKKAVPISTVSSHWEGGRRANSRATTALLKNMIAAFTRVGKHEDDRRFGEFTLLVFVLAKPGQEGLACSGSVVVLHVSEIRDTKY
jgi:hypothetical protein